MLCSPATTNRPSASGTRSGWMLPYVQPVWRFALVSCAMSAAFSPPHSPITPFGGRTGLDGSQGPSSAAAAVKAKAALVIIEPPYQSTLPKPPLVTMRTLRLLLLLACLGLASARAQQRPPLLAGLDAYVAKAMSDWRVPGLAIVIVKDDSVIFIKGYGVRELGKPDPVTVHTRFGNMSTTKAFTAMLVAMLADSGRVSLDDPIQKYLPDVQFADPYVTREIALRDLLTHRVGFADPDYLWGTSGLDFPTIAHRLRFVPVQTSFRSRFQYNNVTYALAGEAAARAAGTTWQSLLHAKILGPLGMTETFAVSRELKAARIADVSSPHG